LTELTRSVGITVTSGGDIATGTNGPAVSTTSIEKIMIGNGSQIVTLSDALSVGAICLSLGGGEEEGNEKESERQHDAGQRRRGKERGGDEERTRGEEERRKKTKERK
jgi:hypothetical protein